MIVMGFVYETGGSLSHGCDRVWRGLPHIRDRLVRVDDPVVPATEEQPSLQMTRLEII